MAAIIEGISDGGVYQKRPSGPMYESLTIHSSSRRRWFPVIRFGSFQCESQRRSTECRLLLFHPDALRHDYDADKQAAASRDMFETGISG